MPNAVNVRKFSERMQRAKSGNHIAHQLLRYGLIAGSGYLLAIALYSGELAVGIPPYVGLGVAFVLNGLYNFALIRVWAFPSSGRRMRSELARFCVVAAGSVVVNYASFAILYSALSLAPATSQRLAILIAAPFTFIGNRLWSFRRHPETSASAQARSVPAATSERNKSYSRM
jgi:putative flippase GtrA